MKQNNPEERPLGVEHQWSHQHLSSWLQDGMAYAITLDDNTCITDAVFHYCTLFGKHYFTKGASVYPIENVQSHSLTGKYPRLLMLPHKSKHPPLPVTLPLPTITTLPSK